MSARRVRIVIDDDADLSYLEDGDPPYTDPADVASFGVIVEVKCEHCGQWSHVDSLWGVDIIYADPELPECGTYSDDDEGADFLLAALTGYARIVADEMMPETVP